MSPLDVEQLSLWQFGAAVDGWMAAQGIGETDVAPTNDEFNDMVLKYG